MFELLRDGYVPAMIGDAHNRRENRLTWFCSDCMKMRRRADVPNSSDECFDRAAVKADAAEKIASFFRLARVIAQNKEC